MQADEVVARILRERGMSMKRAPRANAYRDAWCGDLPRAERRRARRASPAGCTAAATTAG